MFGSFLRKALCCLQILPIPPCHLDGHRDNTICVEIIAKFAMAHMSHKTQNPRKNKLNWPKSSSKVGFGGSLEVGQKVGPEVGFYCRDEEENLLSDLLWDLFLQFPQNLLLIYFWATLFFRGISGLVAHRAVTKQTNSPNKFVV